MYNTITSDCIIRATSLLYHHLCYISSVFANKTDKATALLDFKLPWGEGSIKTSTIKTEFRKYTRHKMVMVESQWWISGCWL